MHQPTDGTADAFLDAVANFARRDELAGVVIHMNDTYLVGERYVRGELACPGFARIGAFVHSLREVLDAHALGDRLLLAHAGDFLSPSYLSNQRGTHGAHMVDVLAAVGVTHLTLGNHEFDHDPKGEADILLKTLQVGRVPFDVVTSNMEHAALPARRLVYWPEPQPFAAIIGLAGAATIDDAAKHGFTARSWEETLEPLVDEIVVDGRASLLLVISHCDRLEDKALQSAINKLWRHHGVALIVGGHDHHVDWTEPHGVTLMVKNPSNLASVTATILPKRIVARPNSLFIEPVDPPPADEVEMRKRRKRLRSSADFDDVFPRPGETDFAQAVADVQEAVRAQAGSYRSPDLIDAFCCEIAAIAEADKSAILDDLQNNCGRQFLYDRAVTYTQGDFILGARAELNPETRHPKLLWRIRAAAFAGWAPDPLIEDIVARWTVEAAGPAGGPVWTGAPDGSVLDARDESLRFRSTNFGNFVADCVATHLRCDLALLNSGGFRSDIEIGTPLLMQDVRETFVYDAADSLVALELTGEEVAALIAHGGAMTGKGAFPQVSAGAISAADTPDGKFCVAIPRYLLNDNHDGYRECLLTRRGIASDAFDAIVAEARTAGVIESIAAAAAMTDYEESMRVSGAILEMAADKWMRELFALAEQFDNVCASLGVGRYPEIFFDNGPDDPAWRKARNAMADHVEQIFFNSDLVEERQIYSRFKQLYDMVKMSEMQGRQGRVDYCKLLDEFFSDLFALYRHQQQQDGCE